CIHLALSADGFQRVRPWLALAHAEHLVQAFARHLVFVNRTAMQGPGLARSLAERTLKLELQDARQEISRIGSVGSDVIFGAGIEVGLAALDRWRNALI